MDKWLELMSARAAELATPGSSQPGSPCHAGEPSLGASQNPSYAHSPGTQARPSETGPPLPGTPTSFILSFKKASKSSFIQKYILCENSRIVHIKIFSSIIIVWFYRDIPLLKIKYRYICIDSCKDLHNTTVR